MSRFTDRTSYAEAQAHAAMDGLWALFDGDRDRLNIAHECITRHADGSGRAAVRIAHGASPTLGARDEILSFDEISSGAARFAHWLEAQGVAPGERIAFMLEPSLAFYVCLPGAVRHTHKALVTLMFAALYGTGIRPGDAFFCPSSPAWGHGLWHGTLAPLGLGVTTGTFAGRFDPVRLMRALDEYGITNMSAAATHYRMMKNSGKPGSSRSISAS